MAITASYIQQSSYYPSDLMVRDADFVQPGVVTLNDLTATASTTSLQVTISGSAETATGGNAWVPGGYRLNNSAALALTLAAADATNPRIDLIEAGVDTTVNPYSPTIRVVTGTPAASPSVPATDSGFIALYEVAVPANATVPGTVTDVRQLAAPSQGIYTAVPVVVAPTGTKILVYAGGALTPYVSYAGAWVAIATEAWVTSQISSSATPLASSAPPAIGTANVQGTSTAAARADHTHEGVASFNGRVGAVTPASGDYTAAEVGAIATSALSGTTPSAVAASGSAGTSSDVARADHTHAGVTSFNGRQGDVAPASGDYTAAEVTNAADKSSASQQTFTGNVAAPALIVSGLTGATAASRYVGATTSGAPTSGTFAAGDFVIDQSGAVWVCSAAGSPGTWKQIGAGYPEQYIPLWPNASTGSGTSLSASAAGGYFAKYATNLIAGIVTAGALYTVPSSAPTSQNYALELGLWGSVATNAALWDITTGSLVSGSTISTTGTANPLAPLRSSQFTLTPGHAYTVTVWVSASGNLSLADASLVVLS